MEWKLIVCIILLIVLILLIWYLVNKREIKEIKMPWYYNCQPPSSAGGYNLCCRDNNLSIPCLNKTNFRCGEEIVVMLNLNFGEQNYICIDRNALLDDWSEEYYYNNHTRVINCLKKGQSPILVLWTGKIPSREGKFDFANVYFISSNYTINYEELIFNLDSYKKIIELNGDVKC